MITHFRFAGTILIACINAWSSYADENLENFSLMYTPDECHYIQHTRQSAHVKKSTTAVTTLQLQGVAYTNSKKWTVWINNDRIDPEHPHPYIDVVSVSPTKISIVLKDKLHSAVVELHINQRLDLAKIHYAEQEEHHSNGTKG